MVLLTWLTLMPRLAFRNSAGCGLLALPQVLYVHKSTDGPACAHRTAGT